MDKLSPTLEGEFLFSCCIRLCDPMDCSTPGFPVFLYLLEFAQTHGHPTISSSVSSFSSCPQSFPASGSFPMCWLFTSGVQNIGASASVLPVIFRVDFLQDCLVGSPFSPRDSQECSPTPQFKNINSLLLSLLYGPTLIPIYDYWKNLSFDSNDLCHKVMSLLFNMLSRFVTAFLPRSKHLHFMIAATICSDFGAQENKIYQFPLFPIYLPKRWLGIKKIVEAG